MPEWTYVIIPENAIIKVGNKLIGLLNLEIEIDRKMLFVKIGMINELPAVFIEL